MAAFRQGEREVAQRREDRMPCSSGTLVLDSTDAVPTDGQCPRWVDFSDFAFALRVSPGGLDVQQADRIC